MRAKNFPSFPFSNTTVSAVLLGVSKVSGDRKYPYVIHLSDLTVPSYTSSNRKLATCYDFLNEYYDGGEVAGLTAQDWAKTAFDVICFDSEYDKLATKFKDATGTSLDRIVRRYTKTWSSGSLDIEYEEHGQKDTRFVADKGYMVSMCVTGRIYREEEQIKVVDHPRATVPITVYKMDSMPSGVLEHSPDTADLCREYLDLRDRPSKRPRKATTSHRNDATTDGLTSDHETGITAVIPKYSALSELRLDRSTDLHSFYVHVHIVRLLSNLKSHLYYNAAQGYLDAKQLSVEIQDDHGSTLPLEVQGTDLFRFLGITLSPSVQPTQDQIEAEIRARLQHMIQDQPRLSMLIRHMVSPLAPAGSAAYIHVWRWIYNDIL